MRRKVLLVGLFILLGHMAAVVVGLVMQTTPMKVVVVGAGSPVGQVVFRKLLKRNTEFHPVGLVRNYRGYKELRRLGAKPEHLRICDTTQRHTLKHVFDGAEKVVICSSASPKPKLTYKIKNAFLWLVGRSRPPHYDELFYRPGRRPYEVDYLGQRNVVDECVDAKVEHVVLLGSMGGYRGSKLNEIGRTAHDPDMKNGNILKWKRAAERYLMKRRLFTIIHAGTITEDPGKQHEIIWDTDDALLRTPYKKIPKEDVAECIVQALRWKEAIGRSIDIASGPVSKATTDWLRFWARPGNCLYPADFDGFPAE